MVNRLVVALVVIVALSATHSLPWRFDEQAVAQQGSAPVHVVSPLPLPVSGTTSVAGTVAVTQSGPWTVGFSGAPEVVVSNPAGNPVLVRSVEEAARVPYLEEVQLGFTPNNTTTFCTPPTSCSLWFPPVPSGKRLIVESISGIVLTAPNDTISSVSLTSSGTAGSSLGYVAPFGERLLVTERVFNFNIPFQSYVNEGANPIVYVVVSGTTVQGTTGNQRARIVIAGRLIDLP